MEFKIDTKETYSHITPQSGHLDANLTGALVAKKEELAQKGSKNLIVDLSQCTKADPSAFGTLIDMHTDSYSENNSLVFTGIHEPVMEEFKKNNIDTALNITPTLIEAIDIISMEILERDLLNEE
jgi:anti-anti-sigma regulatory factor